MCFLYQQIDDVYIVFYRLTFITVFHRRCQPPPPPCHPHSVLSKLCVCEAKGDKEESGTHARRTFAWLCTLTALHTAACVLLWYGTNLNEDVWRRFTSLSSDDVLGEGFCFEESLEDFLGPRVFLDSSRGSLICCVCKCVCVWGGTLCVFVAVYDLNLFARSHHGDGCCLHKKSLNFDIQPYFRAHGSSFLHNGLSFFVLFMYLYFIYFKNWLSSVIQN